MAKVKRHQLDDQDRKAQHSAYKFVGALVGGLFFVAVIIQAIL